MSDHTDLIIIRGTDTPLDGGWYDRSIIKKMEVICPATTTQFTMAPTGEFEQRADGERGEVWVPLNRLLAYLFRPASGARFPTWTSTEAN